MMLAQSTLRQPRPFSGVIMFTAPAFCVKTLFLFEIILLQNAASAFRFFFKAHSQEMDDMFEA
jgi:hypothetical protein